MNGKTYDVEIKEEVQKLRGKGKTYSEIQRHIGMHIPKSTLSSWCQNVVLPDWYQEKVDALNKRNFRKAQRFALASNRLKQERFMQGVRLACKKLEGELKRKGVLKLMLAFLYLGEGGKWKSHAAPMLGSSDPKIIQLYIKLLDVCYGVTIDMLKCRISYRADQDIRVLERYWSKVTGIGRKNFYKTIPDPRTIGKPTRRKDYKGVCVVFGGGTAIQRELEMIPEVVLERMISKGP